MANTTPGFTAGHLWAVSRQHFTRVEMLAEAEKQMADHGDAYAGDWTEGASEIYWARYRRFQTHGY